MRLAGPSVSGVAMLLVSLFPGTPAAPLPCQPPCQPWAPAHSELPYEELAQAYLELVEVPPEPLEIGRGGRLAALLAALAGAHRVIDLGSVELWLPARVLRSSGSVVEGPEPREARGWAEQLVALERRFVELAWSGDERAAAQPELDLLRDFAAGLEDARGLEAAADDPALARARERVAELLTRGTGGAGGGRRVILLAPTRRHLVAQAAALGVLLPSERGRLWSPELSAVAYTNPLWGLVSVCFETGPERGSDGLTGMRVAPEDLEAVVVHRAAHFLVERLVERGPHWLREGLAVDATIALTGNDDSPCTGFQERNLMANLLWLPNWIESDASPYREGPARGWFRKELRPRRRGGELGFPIHDLDRSKVGLWLPGPILGGARDPDAGPPDPVLEGGRGIERGYAEFLRAYSAAFVHWLGLEQRNGRSLLSWLVEFLAEPARHGGIQRRDLVATGLLMASERTLGRSHDPDRDLEAAFAAWLAQR